MAAAEALPREHSLRRIALASLIVLCLLLGAVIVVRLWLNSDSGRAYVVQQLNEREVGPLGRIYVEGLSGDPLTDLRAQRITLSDEDGVWAEGIDVGLDWSGLTLLRRIVSIEQVTAKQLTVLRRPRLQTRTERRPPAFRIRMNSLDLPLVILEEGVAGPEASFAVNARLIQGRDGRLEAALQALPLAGRGDRVKLTVSRAAGSRFDVQIDAQGPAGGTFAHLLGLGEETAVALLASAAGDLADGRGEARLTIGGRDAAFLTGQIEAGTLTTSATLRPTQLPLPPRVALLLGDGAGLTLVSRLGRNDVPFDIEALGRTGEVRIKGVFDQRRRRLVGPARLSADVSTLAPFADVATGLSVNGSLDYDGTTLSYAGPIRLIAQDRSPLPYDALAGTIELAWDRKIARASGMLDGLGQSRLSPALSKFMGEGAKVSFDVAADTMSGQLDIAQLTLAQSAGQISASGAIDLTARRLALKGSISRTLDGLQLPISGRALGTFALRGTADDATLDLDLGVSEIGELPSALQALFAGTGQLRGPIRFSGGLVTADQLRLQFPNLSARIDGQLAGPGGLRVSTRLEAPANLQLADTRLSVNSMAADLRRPPSGSLVIDAQTDGARIESGNYILDITSAAASLGLRNEGFTAPVTITGSFEDRPVTASMLLTGHARRLEAEQISISWAGLEITGRARRENDSIEAKLAASGEGVVWAGLRASRISADGQIVISGDTISSLTAALTGADLSWGEKIVAEKAVLKLADAPLNTLSYSIDATGRFAEQPVAFAAGGHVRQSGRTLTGTLNLAGTADGEPVKTHREARWQSGKAPFLDLDLALLGGTLSARLNGTGEARRATFSLENVASAPLLRLAGLRGIEGRLSGDGDLRPFGTTPSGTWALRLLPDIPSSDLKAGLSLAGRIDNGEADIRVAGAYGENLDLSGRLKVPLILRAGELARADPSGRLAGSLKLKGNLSDLRFIALAYGHDLSGEIDARITVGGTVSAPSVTSSVSVEDVRYEHGQSGFRLKGLSADARFENGAFFLDGSASGGSGGKVSATGAATSGGGRIRFELEDLTVYDRHGMKARVSGEAFLTEARDARIVSGNLRLDSGQISLDALPSARPRRLDVRWREDLLDEPPRNLLAKPIRLDLNVTAIRSIAVTGRGLDSDWSADLTINGPPTRPFLRGRADLARGALDLTGRPFEFSGGRISFDGPLSAARLSLVALRDVNGLTTRADVTGPLLAPQITLTSIPELPQEEILARLLFGRPTLALTPFEGAQLAASIAAFAGEGASLNPLSQVQDGLGLDRLALGFDDAGNPELGAGRYIAPDVYLEVRTTGARGNTLAVEWQPRDDIAISSETRSTGESRVSVRWKRDY